MKEDTGEGSYRLEAVSVSFARTPHRFVFHHQHAHGLSYRSGAEPRLNGQAGFAPRRPASTTREPPVRIGASATVTRSRMRKSARIAAAVAVQAM